MLLLTRMEKRREKDLRQTENAIQEHGQSPVKDTKKFYMQQSPITDQLLLSDSFFSSFQNAGKPCVLHFDTSASR